MPSLPQRPIRAKKSPPNFSLLHQFGQYGYQRIVGLDEVGRGAMAGPLIVAAVELNHQIDGITDSKLLSARKRQFLATKIHQQASQIRVGSVAAAEIDRIGLAAAQRLAYDRALEHIEADLFLTDHYVLPGKRHIKAIRGDSLFYPVAAASIVAKVLRDQVMAVYGGFYPHYNWQQNVGYGTPDHRAIIVELGLTCLHRQSFYKKTPER